MVSFARHSLNKVLMNESTEVLKSQAGVTATQVQQDPINSAAMLAYNALQMSKMGRVPNPNERQSISTPLGVYPTFREWFEFVVVLVLGRGHGHEGSWKNERRNSVLYRPKFQPNPTAAPSNTNPRPATFTTRAPASITTPKRTTTTTRPPRSGASGPPSSPPTSRARATSKRSVTV